MTTFVEFIESNRKGKVKAEINERWLTRVVPKNLHQMGQDGAVEYLNLYGKGISTPKVVQFALKAEEENCPEMALGFWLKAFELETGTQPDSSEYAANSAQSGTKPAPQEGKASKTVESNFPQHLQPGKFVTMQPVDAPKPREFYIDSPNYLGQPKRDGTRMVVFVEDAKVHYQSRSMSLRASPSLRLDEVFLAAAKGMEHQTYILDGELTYLDCHGGEHRTGAQAAQVNEEAGKSSIQPEARYCVFEAVCFENSDLTSQTKQKRIEAGGQIYHLIQQTSESQDLVECLPTAFTKEEKQALSSKQKGEDREGEVWTLIDTGYIGGKTKGKDLPTVRTKYLTNWELVVTGLTAPQVQGRPFGAIEVARVEDSGVLTPMGSVGTGFTLDEMKTIAENFTPGKNTLTVKVISQGLTENGQLWHARYDGLPEEE